MRRFDNYKAHVPEIIDGMFSLYEIIQSPEGWSRRDSDDQDETGSGGFVFQVSLNRPAAPALDRSVPAVKADAANSLFKVNCKNIVWAVLDSGIDREHEAFLVDKGKSRIRKTFDFTRIREIVSDDEGDIEGPELEKLAKAAGLDRQKRRNIWRRRSPPTPRKKLPINWPAVEKLITLKNPPLPPSPHGTHVAGIIGAKAPEGSDHADGMCPDIADLRFPCSRQDAR